MSVGWCYTISPPPLLDLVPENPQAKGKDNQLLTIFQRAEKRGLGLKRQSYTWAVVAYKRCGRTKEALDSALSFSERGIVVSLLVTLVLSAPPAPFTGRVRNDFFVLVFDFVPCGC